MDTKALVRRQKRRSKKRIRRIKRIISLVLIALMIIIVIATIVYFAVKIALDNRGKQTSDVPAFSETTEPQTIGEQTTEPENVQTEPAQTEPETVQAEPEPAEPEYTEPETITVTVTREDIYRGRLILVNAQYPYVFPETNDMVDTYQYRSSAYKFRDNGMLMDKVAAAALNDMLVDFYEHSGVNDVNIISTYRDLETQQRIYDNKVASYGDEETARKWVAYPGTSEHHTGYAVDLGIYTDDGESYDFRGENEYGYINNNCYKFGFVVRYDSAKTDITGIAYEPWHFRYLGFPHAQIATELDLCYEEYMAYIKVYPVDGKHLIYTGFDGTQYESFYVQASGDTTDIILPKGSDYSISGNNIDGYIVTVTLSTEQ